MSGPLEQIRDAVRHAWGEHEKQYPTFGRWAIRWLGGQDRSRASAQACYEWVKDHWTAPPELAAACLAVVTLYEAEGLFGSDKASRLETLERYCDYVRGRRSTP